MKAYKKAQKSAFQVLENGTLRISRPKGKIREMRAFLANNGDDGAFIWEFFESQLCNGYSRVSPESIGALTEGLLIADGIIDDETTKEDFDRTCIWWHESYMVQSFGQTILKKGYIDLPKAS